MKENRYDDPDFFEKYSRRSRACLKIHFRRSRAYNKRNADAGEQGFMAWESKRMAVSALGLPRDVILGDALISLVGNCQVNIENYRGLLFYTDTQVKIRARNGQIVIRGEALCIERYTAEEMMLTGRIHALEFC